MKVVGNIGWKQYVIKKLNKIIMHSRHQWFAPWKFFISDDDPPPPNHTSSQQSYYNLNQNCLLKPNWQSRKVITRTYGRLFWQFSLAPGPLPKSMLYMYIHNKNMASQATTYISCFGLILEYLQSSEYAICTTGAGPSSWGTGVTSFHSSRSL